MSRLMNDRVKLEIKRASGPFLLFVLLVVAGILVGANTIRNLAGDKPWVSYTKYKVAFENVKGVVPGRHELRIAGVKAGSITDSVLVDGRPVMSLNVEKKYAPLYRDAKVRIRPVTPLEDMYVDIESRGTKAAGELKSGENGEVLAVRNTTSMTEIGRVLNVFDDDARLRFGELLSELGKGLNDNGAQLRAAFAEIAPFLTTAERMGRALTERRRNLARLVHNFGGITEVLAKRDKQLADFVTSGESVLSELAIPRPGAVRDARPPAADALEHAQRLRQAAGDRGRARSGAARPAPRRVGDAERPGRARPLRQGRHPVAERAAAGDAQPAPAGAVAAPDVTLSGRCVHRAQARRRPDRPHHQAGDPLPRRDVAVPQPPDVDHQVRGHGPQRRQRPVQRKDRRLVGRQQRQGSELVHRAALHVRREWRQAMKIGNLGAKALGVSVIAFGAALILAYFYSAAGGNFRIGEGSGYRVSAVTQPQQILKHADVRSAGVKVGKVSKVINRITPGGTLAIIEMELKDEFDPIYKNATVTVRQKTLVGENYVDITRGDPQAGEVPRKGTLPLAQDQEVAPVDKILNALDSETRERISHNLQVLGAGFKGRSKDWNRFLGSMEPALHDGGRVMSVLEEQKPQVAALVDQTGTVLQAIANRTADMQHARDARRSAPPKPSPGATRRWPRAWTSSPPRCARHAEASPSCRASHPAPRRSSETCGSRCAS